MGITFAKIAQAIDNEVFKPYKNLFVTLTLIVHKPVPADMPSTYSQLSTHILHFAYKFANNNGDGTPPTKNTRFL